MNQGRVQRLRLLGRRRECEALDQLLTDALVGQSRVIVVRGETGGGKSALLRYLSGQKLDISSRRELGSALPEYGRLLASA